MTIELRVLTGARAGHRARFDGPTISIGRHPQCDLQLAAQEDLDVSSRHAELRVGADDAVLLEDLGSTNGTFINGMRVRTHRLSDGDVVQLGADGPRVEVRIGTASGVGRRASGASLPPRSTTAGLSGTPAPRRPTPDAVQSSAPDARRPTPNAQRLLGWSIAALLIAGVGTAYALGARRSSTEVAELRRLVAEHDSMTRALAQRLGDMTDSNVIQQVRRGNDSLRIAVQTGTVADRAEARERYAERRERAEAITTLDMPAINAQNAPAVAYLVSELDGRVVAGTAFAISSDGRMLTNRHLVRTGAGAMATRLAVKFRDSREWRVARVVRVADAEHDDLALLQVDDPSAIPVVRGIARGSVALREGAPVVTIGYPLGRSLMMEGSGDDFIARTSLYPGTVSKVLPEVLQLAAFAGHGASGSPVFDASGMVVGVVWGGPAESQGKLVYAVPAERVGRFLNDNR